MSQYRALTDASYLNFQTFMIHCDYNVIDKFTRDSWSVASKYLVDRMRNLV